MNEARITRVAGAMVQAVPLNDAQLYELVRVGERGLMGEIIRTQGEIATIQVFEDTSSLSLGETVERSGAPLCAHLGPGLLGSILDGVGRSLGKLAELEGDFIAPGTAAPSFDLERRWQFQAERSQGDAVGAGDVLGWVEERPGFRHSIMVPPGVGGTIIEIDTADRASDETVAKLDNGAELPLAHTWPVRRARPRRDTLPGTRPFFTGQRVLDLLFPVAEGGSVAVPGGFGTGKTVIEQSLAKYADADIVVYVGCGERGNEMAEVLRDFRELSDPRGGGSLMDRTILIVNTSNMPVAARESSVYLGMTYAEYYRDMGYRVAVLADSTSRWAEAMREMSSLLEEMPGEEGYPTALGSRLGRLYERAGRVRALGEPERDGAVTLISAISPPGGDFSEPVTQASLRVVSALWGLDARLAQQRQFPAVDWEVSYSLDADRLESWLHAEVDPEWGAVRRDLLDLLQRDRELREVVGLVGLEALDEADRLALDSASTIRLFVIGQSAYLPADAYSSPHKTLALASLARDAHRWAESAVREGQPAAAVDHAAIRRALAEVRNAHSDDIAGLAPRVAGSLQAHLCGKSTS